MCHPGQARSGSLSGQVQLSYRLSPVHTETCQHHVLRRLHPAVPCTVIVHTAHTLRQCTLTPSSSYPSRFARVVSPPCPHPPFLVILWNGERAPTGLRPGCQACSWLGPSSPGHCCGCLLTVKLEQSSVSPQLLRMPCLCVCEQMVA